MAEYEHQKYQITSYKRALWDNYEKIELAWFAQNASDDYADICKELDLMILTGTENVFKKIQELKKEAARAQTVLDDWKTFNKHLEENPTIKEGWEALLMAIRLTEEDEEYYCINVLHLFRCFLCTK